jgi:integrating conjugative element protein (TIGR03746 family)
MVSREDTVMRFQNALENARLSIQIAIVALGLFFISNLFLIISLHNAQSKMEIHIPPQIPADGITLHAGEEPASTVFSFAYYIWQSLNSWPANGSQDYKNNIQQFSPYLTPRFKIFLIRDYNERFNQGEIQERIRTLQGLNGTAFSPADVDYIGHDTWIVHLQMRLTEHMNMNGNQVKDVAIDYAIRIVKYNVDANKNQWGLAVDGFAENPQRTQTYV